MRRWKKSKKQLVKLKILDDTNSRLNDMEKQIRKNTENINSLKYPTNTDGRRIDR